MYFYVDVTLCFDGRDKSNGFILLSRRKIKDVLRFFFFLAFFRWLVDKKIKKKEREKGIFVCGDYLQRFEVRESMSEDKSSGINAAVPEDVHQSLLTDSTELQTKITNDSKQTKFQLESDEQFIKNKQSNQFVGLTKEVSLFFFLFSLLT